MQVLSRVTLAGPQFVLVRSAARGLALSVAKLAQTCGQQPKSGELPPGCPTHQTHTQLGGKRGKPPKKPKRRSFISAVNWFRPVIRFQITLILK